MADTLTVPHSLAEQAEEIYAWAVSKGWEPDTDRTFGDECALMTSEVSEALEAYRDHEMNAYVTVPRTVLVDGRVFQVAADKTDVYYVENQEYGIYKPEGVPSELADLYIRLLHYAHKHKIDLQAEVDAKMAYNTTRPWRHGGRNL